MPRARIWLTVTALLTLTAVAYLPLWDNGFIDYDDDLFITDNPQVTDGLTSHGFAWAWTTLHGYYWQPLSWLSLQADAQFFTTSASGERQPSATFVHGQSLCWHAASTLLLFGLLRRLTEAWGRSFLVAALFAIHPMHVESVAWAAERKDVLSVFFGIVTLWAYVLYVEKPGWKRYLPLMAAFLLSLLAKPMLITLPFTLLLLDYWPLGRLRVSPAAEGVPFRRLLGEKVPLFLLAAGSAVITIATRAQTGSIVTLENLPLSVRLPNAVTAYGWYLAHTIWPRDLAVLYPHPEGNWPLLPALAGGALLLGGTLGALWQRRQRPWLIVGWLWFVGALLPVIGLVQGGGQVWADRFSYWPHIGLFVVVVWGLAELVGRLRVPVAVTGLVAALMLAALAVLTWVQVGYWHDPLTLWERALAVTRDNYIARDHLTSYYLKNNRPDQAMAQAVEAVRIHPGSPTLHYSLGVVLLTLGRNDEAAVALLDAVHIDPASADAWHNLGVARLRQGRPEQAARSLGQALALEPGSADTRANLGLALWRSGHREEGLRAMQSALDLDPELADAWHGLGIANLTQGRPEEATKALAQALRLNPGLIGAYSNLGLALGRRGQWAGAVGCHRRAVAMQETFEKWLTAVHGCAMAPEGIPQIVIYRCRLAFALDHLGDRAAADDAYREALRCDPTWPQEFLAWAQQLNNDSVDGRRDSILAEELTAQAARGQR